jgi:hypothetical protein
VANSIEGFVQAAQTPEQRDIILGRLVDSVVSFGSSGLNDKDADNVSVSNLTIEAILKNLPKTGG